MLGTSCCLNLPDVCKNVPNIIEHMKLAVATPEDMSSSLDSWFLGLDEMADKYSVTNNVFDLNCVFDDSIYDELYFCPDC